MMSPCAIASFAPLVIEFPVGDRRRKAEVILNSSSGKRTGRKQDKASEFHGVTYEASSRLEQESERHYRYHDPPEDLDASRDTFS